MSAAPHMSNPFYCQASGVSGSGLLEGEACLFVSDEESFVYHAVLTAHRPLAVPHKGSEVHLWAVEQHSLDSVLLMSWFPAFVDGAMEIMMEYPVAALFPGSWILWLEFKRRTLALDEVVIVSDACFGAHVRLESVTLWDPENTGTPLSELRVIAARRHAVVCPAVQVTAPRAYTGRPYVLTLVVTVDDLPEAKWEQDIIFEKPSVQIVAEGIRFPDDLESSTRLTYGFLVFVEGKFLGARYVNVCPGHGAVADAEGRLVQPFDEETVDISLEAERILREAGAA